MRERVILHSTYERALAAAKARARSGAATLGVKDAVPAAYLAECWELWGDGRRLVAPMERLLLMRDVLEGSSLGGSLGMAQALARFAARYAGQEALEEAIASGQPEAPFTGSERDALAALGAYRDRLAAHGLVEPEEAACQLCAAMPPAALEVADPLFVGPGTRQWVERLLGDPLPAGPFALPALASGVQARFSFPAGHTALARAVLDEVRDALGQARSDGCPAPVIVVCGPDAAGLFDGLGPALAQEGASCSLRASLPFCSCDLGRTVEALRRLAEGKGPWREAATDLACSPLLGIAPYQADALNAAWRRDRLMAPSQAASQLREASSLLAPFEALLREGSPSSLQALAEALASKVTLPAESAAIARSALQALSGLLEPAASLGASAHWGELASAVQVPLSLEQPGGGPDAPQVRFCDLRALGSLSPASAYAVVMADMTDGAFAASAAAAPLDGLVEKLGLPEPSSRFDEQRCAFACALEAATARFACVAPQRTAAQEEAYPAFLFDELIATLPDGADVARTRLFALPAALDAAASRPGEEELVVGLGRAFAAPEGFESLPMPERGRLAVLRMGDYLQWAADGPERAPVLSASAIEAYLQCPYKWFVSRKVGMSPLDESFGPREKGTFAHEAYKELFEQLASEDIDRISEATLPRAHEVLGQVLERLAQEQVERELGERLVAADRIEELEQRALGDQLQRSLDQMALLPSGFSVRAHELELAPEMGIGYAGARLRGSVDRVDVDEASGRFAVWDYKGSIAGHEAGFAEEGDLDSLELPAKVQALIYASALGQVLGGLACAGALYLSYRAQRPSLLAAGSFDPAGYDVSAVAGKGSQVDASFESFLAAVEGKIAPAVAALVAGDIPPDPAKGACDWCPVPDCPGRR